MSIYTNQYLIATISEFIAEEGKRIGDIYKYISQFHPIFTQHTNWKNTIRHNLSYRPEFYRKVLPKKQGPWFLDKSKQRLRSGSIGTFDLSDIFGHNIILHCHAELVFSISSFTELLPKIIRFSQDKNIENYRLRIKIRVYSNT